MCLFTSKTEPEIADKEIIVWKIVRKTKYGIERIIVEYNGKKFASYRLIS